ncbi:MAG TPA: PP2C family protein-serine/threonine phosphatase [bacterium]|nr:PP2C family protein-serine/threonine phosphatase [bacterium]
MFQPKLFYRELDRLLHEIDTGTGDDKWFEWLVNQIVERFGTALWIENGRLYTETEQGFVLAHDVQSNDPEVEGLVLESGYRPIDLVSTHGVFIFDETVRGQSPELEQRLGGIESAALLVNSEPRRILAFGLRSGWERDHLDFALNTIRNAVNQRLAAVNLSTDLAQASEIQRSLLPQILPPLPGFAFAAKSIPASSVGGDFYDFLPQGPDAIGIGVGDASGHGLGAALLARDIVTGLRMGSERDLKMVPMIERLNRVIGKSMLSTRFVSLFYGELETNGNLFYVNAGHPPPWIFGERGMRKLTVGGSILGPLQTSTFKRGFAHMDRGDTLVIVTDGLLERENRKGEMFGETRLERSVREVHGQKAPLILENILRYADKFGGNKPWEDDTTAVVVTRDATPPPAAPR